MSDDKSSVDQISEAKEIEALFVQSAGGMAYDNGRLTMHGLASTTLMFSDRPDRVTGHVPSEEFLDSWGEGDDSFADDPPNAVLSIHHEPLPQDIVVVLRNPRLAGDDLVYDAEVLDGETEAEGTAASLFIDEIGRPLTPISFAGANRRERRRERREDRREDRARRRVDVGL